MAAKSESRRAVASFASVVTPFANSLHTKCVARQLPRGRRAPHPLSAQLPIPRLSSAPRIRADLPEREHGRAFRRVQLKWDFADHRVWDFGGTELDVPESFRCTCTDPSHDN